MWTYGYFLGQLDSYDIGIPIWFIIFMLYNLIIATISRATPGRKRKGFPFQILEVIHYFLLFLRICAVPAFYEEYFEISLISTTSLVAQCVVALYTANDFIQDPPTRSSSSLHLNMENSLWEVSKEEEIKQRDESVQSMAPVPVCTPV